MEILEMSLCLIGAILFWYFMKKFNYDFKGIELIVFWVLFTVLVYFVSADGALMISPIFLGVYYLIRLIKTKKYIKWYLVLIQFLIIIPFEYLFEIYEQTICEGWCMGSVVILLYLLGTVAYMLFINLITLIVKSIIKKR